MRCCSFFDVLIFVQTSTLQDIEPTGPHWYHAGEAVFASTKSASMGASFAKTHELQEAAVMLLVREAEERRAVAEVAVAVGGANRGWVGGVQSSEPTCDRP